ncbi:flagellar protein FlaG [Clostridium sp. 'White wine YQ']|uniref:flagellar protein FlaG n=1 Tax=Clostridium sp. 'White wine YQ' TaxID=3027474 RepID=UPI0023655E17|nr:flagellar protein FlaG [Clostridium sp. 'White wine YQ']MDD7794629.1 flagellar protein FlaG [Clostridium sp. 'White wine YQ']
MDVNAVSQGGQLNLDYQSSATVEKVEIKSPVNEKAKDEKEDKNIKKAVQKLNKFLEDEGTHAVYSTHDKFKKDVMIKIVDNKTNEVILEIPPKKILDMIAKMLETVGVVFDKKA